MGNSLSYVVVCTSVCRLEDGPGLAVYLPYWESFNGRKERPGWCVDIVLL